jgi:hypothetical protein
MLKYPVRAALRNYSGENSAERQAVADFNTLATRLTAHVNECVAKSDKDIAIIEYHEIAKACGVPREDVAAVFESIGGGHSGLTVAKT